MKKFIRLLLPFLAIFLVGCMGCNFGNGNGNGNENGNENNENNGNNNNPVEQTDDSIEINTKIVSSVCYKDPKDDDVLMQISNVSASIDASELKIKITFAGKAAMWGKYKTVVLIDDTDITSTYNIENNGSENAASYITTDGNVDFYITETPEDGVVYGPVVTEGKSVKTSHTWSCSNYLYKTSGTSLTYTIPLELITNGNVKATAKDHFRIVAFASKAWWDSSAENNVSQVISAVPAEAVEVLTVDNDYDKVAIDFTQGLCISAIRKYSVTIGNAKEEIKVVPVDAVLKDSFIRGFDASAVNDYGQINYFEDDGTKTDVFKILKNHGYNYVRLRVWNNPLSSNNPSTPGSANKDTVLSLAKRAKEAGLKILLDFHYSDYWADPGKQLIPEKWLSCTTSDEMAEKVKSYTEEVLTALKEQNTLPDIVQVGNEINSGVLVDKALSSTEARTSADSAVCGSAWSPATIPNFTKYLAAGISAVREIAPDAEVMLHVAEGGNSDLTWIFDIFKNASLDYDIIGLSYYPVYASHKNIMSLGENIENWKAAYNKKIIVVETSFDWAGSSSEDKFSNAKTNLTVEGCGLYSGINSDSSGNVEASYQNQANVVRAVIEVAAKNGAEGVFYWGGEYKGNWSGLFSGSGVPLPSLNVFQVTGK